MAAAAVDGNSGDSSADMGSSSGEDGFWDRRVVAPSGAAIGGGSQDHYAARTHDQPAAMVAAAAVQPGHVMPAQPPHPAGVQKPASDAAPGGNSNDLARLFAGIKMGPAPAAAAPPPQSLAGAPGPLPAAAAAPMMLLTPQLLQQEAAGAAPEVGASAGAGSALLQSLLRGSQQQQQPPPAAPEPAPQPVDITGKR